MAAVGHSCADVRRPGVYVLVFYVLTGLWYHPRMTEISANPIYFLCGNVPLSRDDFFRPLDAPANSSPGPQISFDLDLGGQFEGREFGFDTTMYTSYLRGKGLEEEQIAAGHLAFRPARSDRSLGVPEVEYDLATSAMIVHVSPRQTADDLTRSVFRVSDYFIRHQKGEALDSVRADVAIGTAMGLTAAALDVVLLGTGVVTPNSLPPQSLACIAIGFLSMAAYLHVFSPSRRQALHAERYAAARPLVSFGPRLQSAQ